MEEPDWPIDKSRGFKPNEANRRDRARLNKPCYESNQRIDYTNKPGSISQAKCEPSFSKIRPRKGA